jgi:hypothetical protein
MFSAPSVVIDTQCLMNGVTTPSRTVSPTIRTLGRNGHVGVEGAADL